MVLAVVVVEDTEWRKLAAVEMAIQVQAERPLGRLYWQRDVCTSIGGGGDDDDDDESG